MKPTIAGLALAASTALPVYAEVHRVTMRGTVIEPALLEGTEGGATDSVWHDHPSMRGRIVAN